jgi:hypothetical protein
VFQRYSDIAKDEDTIDVKVSTENERKKAYMIDWRTKMTWKSNKRDAEEKYNTYI